MTISVPTNEPLKLRAGDTWQWRREDLSADFPASAWTLTYRFKNAAGGFEIVAAADGDNFAVNVAAVTTAPYVAGTYAWAARVKQGADEYTVDTGTLEVQPDIFSGTATTASDQRTHSQIAYDAIKAVMENRATKDQQEYTIAGRSLKRTPVADLLKLLNFYESRVNAEINAEKIRNGLSTGGRIQVRL